MTWRAIFVGHDGVDAFANIWVRVDGTWERCSIPGGWTQAAELIKLKVDGEWKSLDSANTSNVIGLKI